MEPKKPLAIIRPVDFASLVSFEKELESESDRAAVILSAARLDNLLFQILQKHLLPCASGRDELFDGEGPLSTFNSKIILAYRLAIIDSVFARTLHLIRKIRNDFAHESLGGSLEHPPHKDRIKQLVAPYINDKKFINLLKLMPFKRNGIGKASADFRATVSLMVLFLEIKLNLINQVKTKPFEPSKFLKLARAFPDKEIKSPPPESTPSEK